MRSILAALVMCTTYASLAARTDSVDKKKWRTEVGGAYGMPLGSFSYRTNDRFLMSQCGPAAGYDLYLLGYTTAQRFTVSLYLSGIPYNINKDKINTQLRERYDNPEYYTSIVIDKNHLEIWPMGIQCSYIFAVTAIEIEPYLQLGYCFGGGSATDIFSVTRKKKGENYSEDITAIIKSKTFFYPGIGLKFNKKVWKGLYASMGVRYNKGTMNYTFAEEVKDYLETKTERSSVFTQPVSAVQIHGGIQYRFKFPKKTQ